jgi:hypothetical protein
LSGLRLVQYLDRGQIAVGRVLDENCVSKLHSGSVYSLACEAIRHQTSLSTVVAGCVSGTVVSYEQLIADKQLLPPLTHPDPAHLTVSGTGLTHLGSAESRATMHVTPWESAELTDSMKMFKLGLEGGKPPSGAGVQPEWFYKGTGSIVVPPEQIFVVPDFAQDTGEEAELVGLYVIGDNGIPWRAGFTLGNELSDHVTERFNYLWLAHSKLRPCSFGPELLVGDVPQHIEGTVRIVRNNETLWEKPFLTGEANMSHSFANLEYHHFKYPAFRRPGDVHAHFFGTATLSFADGISARDGDRFEIHHAAFGRALRNPLRVESNEFVRVKSL